MANRLLSSHFELETPGKHPVNSQHRHHWESTISPLRSTEDIRSSEHEYNTMDTPLDLFRKSFDDEYHTPAVGKIISLTMELLTACVLSSLITQRCMAVEAWGKLPWITWLVFLIYGFSLAYSWCYLLIQFAIGIESGDSVCGVAAHFCPAIYISSKVCKDVQAFSKENQ